jgi:hypothetical protein
MRERRTEEMEPKWMTVRNKNTGEVFTAKAEDRPKLGTFGHQIEVWATPPNGGCQFFDNGEVRGFICTRKTLPKARKFVSDMMEEVV